MTSHEGKLLGDPAFAPVFAEFNRRKTIVFVHPTMSCCGNVFPGVSGPTIEFPTDTTRTILRLALSGTMARTPNVTFGSILGIANAIAKLELAEASAAMRPGFSRASPERRTRGSAGQNDSAPTQGLARFGWNG